MAIVDTITLTDLCQRAMRSINALGQAQTFAPGDLQVCAEAANDMLDAWAAQRLTVFQTLRHVYALTTGKGGPTNPYTIGSGGDFDQFRPLWIPNANVRVSNSSGDPYEIALAVLNQGEYAAIAMKTLTNSIPTCLWFNGRYNETGANAGLGEIFLWMIPNGQQTLSLVLYTPTPLTSFADLTSEYSFPPGYREALRYQLALRLATEFGRPVSPELATLATQTFAVIERPNADVGKLRSDFMGMGRSTGLYDWRTGSSSRRGIY